MSDVKCPYCNKEVEICRDDGYGYSEDQTYTQECGHCKKTFTYETDISFDYTAEQAPCQNGEPHSLKPINGVPKEFFVGKARCEWCHVEIVTDEAASRMAIDKYWRSIKQALND
jgi:hypothetical protein